MKGKKAALMTIILLAVLLSGCGGEETDENRLTVPFIGGKEGLVLSTIDGAPPPTVTDDNSSDFAIILNLENVGEADVGPGTENPFILARLSGVEPSNFDVKKEDLVQRVNQTIAGAKKNFDGTILPGELATASFRPLNYQRRVGETTVFTFRADACYDYATHASLKVCIKDNIMENIQDDTLCRLRNEIQPQNSGAPVHVVEADQNPIGDRKIQVNFVVKNLGNGVVFSRADDDPLSACAFDVRNPAMNKALVVVNPVDTNNYDLDCRGLDGKRGFENVGVASGAEAGVIKLRSNAPRSLTCFLEKTTDISGRVFQDLMNIDIYYRYGEFLEVPVAVQNAGVVSSDSDKS